MVDKDKEAAEERVQRFRFRVTAPDGRELLSEIAQVHYPAPPEMKLQPSFTEPKWVSPNDELHHGEDVTLEVSAPASIEGRAVRFVVEHELNGAWTEFAALPGKVRGGKASARLLLHHPSFSKDKSPSLAELRDAKRARLRFHAELA